MPRFIPALAWFAVLAAFLILMRTLSSEHDTLRVAFAAGGFVIFLALAIAATIQSARER